MALDGIWDMPVGARGLILFAHGSGSGRHSPRNRLIAHMLQTAGLGTLLLDLVTKEEDAARQGPFDLDTLTSRLEAATRWAAKRPQAGAISIGYFGASTGAAVALRAAAGLGLKIGAVVSRGGRPDLALSVLDRVRTPTLLIVGGLDETVIELNQRAYERLRSEKELVIIPGATHLFEEPGALQEVGQLACKWFQRYL